jgi:glycosyltransferase involved in cell wall biosynthesis
VKTRVVSIISRMNVGGPAKLLVELAEMLPKNEFEHILITGVCEKNEIDLLESMALKSKVIYVPELHRTINPLSDLIAIYKIRKLLRELSPDIVHTHMSKAGAVGRLASIISRKKSIRVHTFHGHLLSGYFSNWKIKIVLLFEKNLVFFTSRLVAVSQDVATTFQRHKVGNPRKWIVINPGVHKSGGSIDLERNIETSKKINLIWVGRFEKVKNPLLAVNVFYELSKISPGKFDFTMVGEGQLLVQSVKLANELDVDIHFLGWQSDIQRLFTNSDVLLFTSINEGFGMVVTEAATCGVITVTTDSGGVKDFVEDGETGILSDANAAEFAFKTIDLVSDVANFNRMRENAFEKVNTKFTIENFVQQHVLLYRSLLRKN